MNLLSSTSFWGPYFYDIFCPLIHLCVKQNTKKFFICHQKTQQLSSEIDSLTQLEAVHSYKESHFEKLETRYQEEIAELKRRLNSASEGREYENEVFLDKLTQLRNAEKVRLS